MAAGRRVEPGCGREGAKQTLFLSRQLERPVRTVQYGNTAQ